MPSPLIAHQFNAWTYAGAAIAALRIARSLQQEGCGISLWHQIGQNTRTVEDLHPGTLYYAKPHRWLYARDGARHKKLTEANQEKKGLPFSLPFHSEKPKFYPERYGDGVLHFHWIGGNFFDYEAFFSSVPDEHPIVWTLHDINPLTGGCHLAGDCAGFTAQCGNCPQLVKPSEHDITRKAMETKLRCLRGKNLHFVAPSSWMEGKIRASSLGKLAQSIRTIHNPLDTVAFAPLADRHAAKIMLGLDPKIPIIAFGAYSAKDNHKGIQHLIPALLQIKDSVKFQVVVFGHAIPDGLENSGIPCKCVGYVSYQPIMRMLYSAADILALPSLEESLGQVGTESIACGTPIVAFRTGGIPDYVKHGETGLLAERGNTEELAAKLKDALTDLPRLHAMRMRAREVAVELFEAGQQAKKYKALYAEICTTA